MLNQVCRLSVVVTAFLSFSLSFFEGTTGRKTDSLVEDRHEDYGVAQSTAQKQVGGTGAESRRSTTGNHTGVLQATMGFDIRGEGHRGCVGVGMGEPGGHGWVYAVRGKGTSTPASKGG